MGGEGTNQRRPRFLCLHGFRTSGEIMKKQLTTKWPQSLLEKIDLVYLDAPFPCQGKSEVEGIFDPPYYEWFQFNKEFTEYQNLDKCFDYIEDCIIKHGPIDGLLGFSQGAILSAALPGLQEKGMALKKVPKIKYLIIISGAKFRNQSIAEKAYSSPIQCPSVHFLGDMDFLKPHGTELLESFKEEPVIIHHPKGHTIPRFGKLSGSLNKSVVKFLFFRLLYLAAVMWDLLLIHYPPFYIWPDDKTLEMMKSFLERLQKEVSTSSQQNISLEKASP